MLPQLVCACTVSIIGAALDAHVRSAKDRGWGHPVQFPTAGSDDEIRPPLQVRQATYLLASNTAYPIHAAPLQLYLIAHVAFRTHWLCISIRFHRVYICAACFNLFPVAQQTLVDLLRNRRD